LIEHDFGPVSIGTISDSEGDRDALGVVSLCNPSELLLNDDAVGRLDVLPAVDGVVAHLGADSVPLTNADFSNVARLTKCRSFDFDNTPLADAHLALFAGRPIEFLTVAGTQITDRGMATVGTLTQLNDLFLNRTSITDTGLEHLRGHPSLTKLTAQIDGVTPASASLLRSLSALEEIGLSQMNDDAMRAVATPSLRTCWFNQSEIGAAGLSALANETQIESLFLGLSTIATGALSALVAAESLVNLMLSRTSVGDDDVADIARIPSLGALDLSRTSLTDEGVRHLAACRTLQGLDLSGTAVTDAGMAALIELPFLTNVKVNDTAVTQAALDRLPHLPKAFELAD
jgi:hypothetical protein